MSPRPSILSHVIYKTTAGEESESHLPRTHLGRSRRRKNITKFCAHDLSEGKSGPHDFSTRWKSNRNRFSFSQLVRHAQDLGTVQVAEKFQSKRIDHEHIKCYVYRPGRFQKRIRVKKVFSLPWPKLEKVLFCRAELKMKKRIVVTKFQNGTLWYATMSWFFYEEDSMTK